MKIFFPFIFIAIISNAFAQVQTKSNEHIFGGDGIESNGRLLFDEAGNRYLVCSSNSNQSFDKTQNSRGDYDAWIIKLDENSTIVWDKTIGGNSSDVIFSRHLVNNKIVLVIRSISGISGDKTSAIEEEPGASIIDTWVVCLDLDGNILWQNTYGGFQGEERQRSFITSDTTMIVAQWSSSGISGNKYVATAGAFDIWMFEINLSDGEILRQKSIPSNKIELFNSIYVDESNNVYLAYSGQQGTHLSKTDPGFGNNFCIFKLDPNWNIVADKCFGSTNETFTTFTSIFGYDNYLYLGATSNSNVGGNKSVNSFSDSYDFWLLKLNPDLSIVWDKVYGGTANDFMSIDRIENNRIIISGTTSPQSQTGTDENIIDVNYGLQDIWFLTLDLDGNIQSQQIYGGSGDDFGTFYDNPVNPNQLIFLGYSASPISGTKGVANKALFDLWMFDIDKTEALTVSDISIKESSIRVYPNPLIDNQLKIDHIQIGEPIEFRLFSLDGKLIHTNRWKATSSQASIELFIEPGVYLYEINQKTQQSKGKIQR